jgi:hypothetical protein
MAQKFKNPLAQALGMVLQNCRDKMGGISSFDIASELGLAASHYRMIEAGSAILQPARAIRVVQTFDTIEFVPLCQVLVAIQILDSTKQSIEDMRATADLLIQANPILSKILKDFDKIWEVMRQSQSGQVAKTIVSLGITANLEEFLTTAPPTHTLEEISDFMSPTYQYPMSGHLYDKIGNILQGVAPFYLDTILQLTNNLRGITPRVTPEELARWEAEHKSRITHIIGIIRQPEIILDVTTFDYSFLWEQNFQSMLVVYRDKHQIDSESIQNKIRDCLKARYEAEHLKYERELATFDQILGKKLRIEFGQNNPDDIDKLLFYGDMQMNNLWIYIMASGYVVPFVDNATVDGHTTDMYGTSLAYDETSEKMVTIRKICSDVGFKF